MANSIKIRLKREGEYILVKALVKHPMETGLRKDSSGNKIPAHYIENLIAKSGGTVVFSAAWGTAISANPYISFKFRSSVAGDTLTLSWTDNKGMSDSHTVNVP